MAANSTTPRTDPLPPHNAEAERAVLGSLLIDPDALGRVEATGLQAEEWYVKSHGQVYAVMLALARQGTPVDLVTLVDALADTRNGHGSVLEAIGGPAALTGLVDDTYSTINVEHYARIIRDTAYRRRLIAAAGDMARAAYAHDGERDALAAQVAALVNQAIGVAEPRSHLWGDATLHGYLDAQDARAARLAADPDALVTTGWPRLDGALQEVEPGTVHVVAAATSVGKTTYLECVAEHNARKKKHVAYYHLELSHQAMLDRRMARHSGVPLSELRRGYSGQEVVEACGRMSWWQDRITYIHCPGWTADRIVADIHRLAGMGRCDLAVVDYLSKIPLPASARGLNEASAIGTHRLEPLKNAAEQLGIPVFTASQINRDRQFRSEGRATVDSLRGSGEIAERANQVVIVTRKEGHDPESSLPIPLELTVEKNTNGLAGLTIPMVSIPGRFVFREAAGAPRGEG